MKVSFIITVEGDWIYNGTKVTPSIVEKKLRRAIKEYFEFLASRVTVKREPK